MRFISPSLLWALPFAAVPIIIYYLMRYRSLKIIWGANYVLERALDRLRRKLYLDQVILLTLRVLACAALILAFARPALQGLGGLLSAGGAHNIVVLDGSYSMLAGEESQQRWNIALETLEKMFNGWGRGQRWSLLFLTEEPQWIVESGTFTTAGAAMEVVAHLSVRETPTSLLTAFEAINERYPTGDLAIYLFTDDLKQNWHGMEGATWPKQRQVPVYWFNPPLASTKNLAVTSVQPASDKAVIGHPHTIFVAVRNFSSEPVEDTALELLVDGAFSGRQAVSALPGQERWVPFVVLFDTPGSHYVTARLQKDALEFDNVMSAGVHVVETLNIVVLRDADVTGKFDSAWEFLRIAASARDIARQKDATVLNMGALLFHLADAASLAEKLKTADAVLLDGGTSLTAEIVSTLEHYVNDGGALVLAADERIDRRAWNSQLAPVELLPARLGNMQVHNLGGDRYQSLLASEFAYPALRSFERVDHGNINNARFYSWYEFTDISDDAVVMAQFTDFSPFALRKQVGFGSATLLAAGMNARSNNMMVREFSVPLLVSLFTDAATAGMFPRTVRRGQPIKLHLTDTEDHRAITFSGDGLAPTPVVASPRGNGAIVEVPAELTTTGLYHLTIFFKNNERTRTWFGVQGDRSDSDLTPLADKQRELIRESTGVMEAKTWDELVELMRSDGFGMEWQHWVYVAMLCFLAGELLIERRFV